MLKDRNLKYFNFGEIENKKFWKRLGNKPDLKDKTILDFGCGYGALAIDLAKSGAKRVVGIDLEDHNIDFANDNLNQNYPELKDKIEFYKIDILKTEKFKDFDIIVSKDTFEHTLDLDKVLLKFHQILKDDGSAYLGFGPLYNFYNGDHGRAEAILPWFHLIIPEKTLIKRINANKENKIKKIEELGLNKYSFKQYLNFFDQSNFTKTYFKVNLSDHPIAFIFNILSKLKALEEYFTYNIYCILKKKSL